MDHLVASTGQLSPAASFGLAPKRAKTLLTAANRVSVWVLTFLMGVGLAAFSQTSAAQVTVSTLAGTAGVIGSADGSGAAAQFRAPIGIAADTAGNLFVTDTIDHTIRRVTAAGLVSTLAGTRGVPGSADGTGTAAQFSRPWSIAADTAGNLYVADVDNHTIRKITAEGLVSTLAGTAGVIGSADGSGAAAQFNYPVGIAADTAGNLYVADGVNRTIRKITAAGVVSTLAGTVGVRGSADGIGAAAQFSNPTGIATDTAGNLYVTDSDNRTIRKITAAGVVSTLAGTAGVQGSADGSGAAAQFAGPFRIAADTAGNLYVTDLFNATIRKITAAGLVSTLAGTAGVIGSADGIGAAAQFGSPYGIAADTAGNLYVVDGHNLTIRKITSSPSSSAPGPSIVSIVPSSGPAGTAVTIAGANFGPPHTCTSSGPPQDTSFVTFGSNPATMIISWCDSQVVVIAPANGNATGPLPVTAQVGAQRSNQVAFAYTTATKIESKCEKSLLTAVQFRLFYKKTCELIDLLRKEFQITSQEWATDAMYNWLRTGNNEAAMIGLAAYLDYGNSVSAFYDGGPLPAQKSKRFGSALVQDAEALTIALEPVVNLVTLTPAQFLVFSIANTALVVVQGLKTFEFGKRTLAQPYARFVFQEYVALRDQRFSFEVARAQIRRDMPDEVRATLCFLAGC